MSVIGEIIERCDAILKDPSSFNLYREALEIYSTLSGEIPTLKRGLLMASIDNSAGFPNYDESDALSDIKAMKNKARIYSESIERKLEIEKLKAAQRGTSVVIKDVGNSKSLSKASSHSESNTEIVFTLIDSDSSLTDEEKVDLQSLLVTAKQEAIKNDAKAFAKIGAKILEGVEKATPGVVSGALGWLASLAEKYFGA